MSVNEDLTKHITKFELKNKPNYWREEAHIDLRTLQNEVVHVSRIIYVGNQSDKTTQEQSKRGKRCISIHKNGKTVAVDIELALAIAGALQQLSKGFIPPEWLV